MLPTRPGAIRTDEVSRELVLRIDGVKLSASAADKVRLEMDLPERVEGRVGFWTKRDSTTLFSRLQTERHL